MEEKERYKLESYNEAFCQIHDTELDEWYLRKDLVKDLLNEQDQKIKELEVKLADRTEQLKIALKDFNDIQKENDKFAKQLAEKEKEETKRMEDFEKRCQEYYKSNQTAIRELEKVKKFLLEKIAEKQSCFDSGNYNDFADGVKTICELMLISIDNQINELKEMK